ncbi:proteasome maturation protein [Pelomyxa schiedti]|nr:proteasome maturation protein [Pelomyxa schiedti]
MMMQQGGPALGGVGEQQAASKDVIRLGPAAYRATASAGASPSAPSAPMSPAARPGDEARGKLACLAYGPGFELRSKMDAHILSQFHGLPGLTRSFSGLETFLGLDEDIDFEDYLGEGLETPQLPTYTIHEIMERKLGL